MSSVAGPMDHPRESHRCEDSLSSLSLPISGAGELSCEGKVLVVLDFFKAVQARRRSHYRSGSGISNYPIGRIVVDIARGKRSVTACRSSDLLSCGY
jgi:hypothetical protein